MAGSVLRMGFASVVIVHGLALMNVLDTFSLVFCFFSLGVGRVWQSDRAGFGGRVHGLWTQGHVFVFDLLDGTVKVGEKLRGFGNQGMAQLRRRGLHAYRHLPEALVLAFIGVVCIGLRLPGIAAYPYPVVAREVMHLDAFKILGAGSMTGLGTYSGGSHALTAVLRTLGVLDDRLTWKIMGLALALITASLVFWATRQLSGAKAFIGPALASGLAVLFEGGALGLRPTHGTEVHPWDFAAPACVLVAVLVRQSLTGRQRDADPWGVAMASGLLAFVHPLAWLTMLAGVVLATGGLGAAGVQIQKPGRVLGMFGLGSLPAAAWMGGAYAYSGGKHAAMLWSEIYAPGAQSAGAAGIPILMLGAAGALMLIMLPSLTADTGSMLLEGSAEGAQAAVREQIEDEDNDRDKEKSEAYAHSGVGSILAPQYGSLAPLGAMALGGWTLAALPRLGLQAIFPAAGLEAILTPLSALTVGVAVQSALMHAASLWRTLQPKIFAEDKMDAWLSNLSKPMATLRNISLWEGGAALASRTGSRMGRWASAGSMAVLAGLLLMYPPRMAAAQEHLQPLASLKAFETVKNEMVAGTWTAVAHKELVLQTKGLGWHISREDFLVRYPIETYVWDPRTPESAIPSAVALFFVEKFAPIDLNLSAAEALEREETNARLRVWCKTYMDTHDDMRVFYQDTSIEVYQLERTRESERTVMQQIRQKGLR